MLVQGGGRAQESREEFDLKGMCVTMRPTPWLGGELSAVARLFAEAR